jgi:hypothetical protein
MASSIATPRVMTEAFLTALAENQNNWGRVGKRIDCTGQATIKVGAGAFGGTMSTLARTATSGPTASDYFTFESDFSVVHKVLKHTFPKATYNSEYGFGELGRQMAETVQNTLDADFFALLAGLPAAAHPRAGAGAGQVGAGKKYIDTGLAFLAGEGGAGTQDNLLTGALAEATLNSAIKLLLQYRSDRGVSLNLGANGGLVLVVSPKNAQTAHELVVSAMSGADMASNFIKGQVSDIVVTNHFTDDDDWALVDSKNSPIGMAIGEIDIRMTETSDGLFFEPVCELRSVAVKNPYEAGIIVSNVA